MTSKKSKVPTTLDLHDGGKMSRKFILTIMALALLTGVALLSVKYAAIVAILPTFVGGILGVLSLYFTGNVMNKYVVGKQTSGVVESNGGDQ